MNRKVKEEEIKLAKRIQTKKNLSLKKFKKGVVLGTGTFSRVYQIFYKRSS